MSYRILFLHPKAQPNQTTRQLAKALTDRLVTQITQAGGTPPAGLTLVPSRQAWQTFMATEAPGKNAYAAYAAWVTKPGRYQAAVCDDAHVGRGTAPIIEAFLEAKVPVLVQNPRSVVGELVRVQAVDTVNAADFQTGWTLRT